MQSKLLSVRPAGPLTCVWIATTNRNAPLTCVWIQAEHNIAGRASSTSSAAEEVRPAVGLYGSRASQFNPGAKQCA